MHVTIEESPVDTIEAGADETTQSYAEVAETTTETAGRRTVDRKQYPEQQSFRLQNQENYNPHTLTIWVKLFCIKLFSLTGGV